MVNAQLKNTHLENRLLKVLPQRRRKHEIIKLAWTSAREGRRQISNIIRNVNNNIFHWVSIKYRGFHFAKTLISLKAAVIGAIKAMTKP
jgi:hypothetical protein